MIDIYQKLNYDLADPRTNNFLLVSSPFKLLGILGMYLWFCLKAGPHFMKNREPFKLKTTLMVYNLFQVISSAYFFISCLPYWLFRYSYKCEPVDYSNSPDALYVASMVHLYFLSKLVELVETIFFVLRKKNSQVSTLHLYHHTLMVVLGWIGTKYLPGGQSTLLGFINSFVHVVMYSYYFVSSLGPKYRKYLIWKKQITQLQLAQFIILCIYGLQNLPRECNYPKIFMFFSLIQAVTMIYMFSRFYIQCYLKPKKIVKSNGYNNE